MSRKRIIVCSSVVVAALWLAEAATLLLPRGDHLMWQLDSWLYCLAVAATLALTIAVTVVVCRHRHWALQVLCWMVWRSWLHMRTVICMGSGNKKDKEL